MSDQVTTELIFERLGEIKESQAQQSNALSHLADQLLALHQVVAVAGRESEARDHRIERSIERLSDQTLAIAKAQSTMAQHLAGVLGLARSAVDQVEGVAKTLHNRAILESDERADPPARALDSHRR